MAEQSQKRSSKAALIITPVLLLMLAGGMAVMGWSLAPTHTVEKYLNIAFMDNLKTQTETAGLQILQKQIDTADAEETGKKTYPEGKITYPVFGEQYAQLTADAIGLNVGVFFGSNSELLALGACQTTQSAVLGTVGNVVIDAHVNTYFSELTKLSVGDKVVLYTDYGRFTYRVAESITFDKNDRQYLGVTEGEDHLTLYTCKPELLGNSDVRVGVRCDLVAKEFYEPVQ